MPLLDQPVLTDLSNGLLVAYLVDEGNAFTYVQERHLAEAGVERATLHVRAVENLAETARVNGLEVLPHGDIFAVLCGGNFEASLILVDGLWDQSLRHLAPNGYMVAIPNRDILVLCDSGSEAGIEQLRQVIQRAEGGDHPITTTLYRRDEAQRLWRPHAN